MGTRVPERGEKPCIRRQKKKKSIEYTMKPLAY